MTTPSRQTPGRFWSMFRRLRPIQIYGELMSRIRPINYPAPHVEATAQQTKWSNVKRRVPGLWAPLSEQNPNAAAEGQFDLIGRKIDLKESDGRINWEAPQATDHWQKMLHSLDWLNALSPGQGARILQSYCEGIPSSRHDMAWESWTVAFRIQSLARWQAQHGASDELAKHMASWANHLDINLEWRLTGNHLLKEALSLSLVGRCLEGPRSAHWRRRGDRILLDGLRHDILADGGHEELSPMYHSLVLYDLLDLLAVVYPGDPLYQPLTNVSQRMATLLLGIVAPDGEIPNLSDSGFGLAPIPAILLEQARQLDCSPTPAEPSFRIFPNFGVAVLESPEWWVIFDGGNAGLEHLPAHGHADTLSIEASYRKRRLFVDTGVSVYSDIATRDRERATSAHNTVCIAGKNSSDVYLNFRMGERARVLRFAGGIANGQPWAQAAHDGYRFLAGKPIHSRHVEISGGNTLRIHDEIQTSSPQPWEIRWHLAPDWKIEPPTSDHPKWKFTGSDGTVLVGECRCPQARVEKTSINFRFGHPVATSVIVCPMEAATTSNEWVFSPGE